VKNMRCSWMELQFDAKEAQGNLFRLEKTRVSVTDDVKNVLSLCALRMFRNINSHHGPG
jgi:hypothetical protein